MIDYNDKYRGITVKDFRKYIKCGNKRTIYTGTKDYVDYIKKLKKTNPKTKYK